MSLLIALSLFFFLCGVGVGIGYAVRVIGDRYAESIAASDADHELGGNPL